MDMKTALLNLGVTEDILSEDEKAKLDTDGYLVFYDVLSEVQLQQFRRRL